MPLANPDALAERGIDYADALERFGGNEALYMRLACKYLDDTHFDELQEALKAGDVEAAHQHAHTLKGVAGNLSFKELYQAACRLNELLQAGDTQAAEQIMPEAEKAHQNIRTALQDLAEA